MVVMLAVGNHSISSWLACVSILLGRRMIGGGGAGMDDVDASGTFVGWRGAANMVA